MLVSRKRKINKGAVFITHTPLFCYRIGLLIIIAGKFYNNE